MVTIVSIDGVMVKGERRVKRCCRCGETKARKEFHWNSRTVDCCAPMCKECDSQRKRVYYEQNRERIVEERRAYRRAHPDTVRASAHKHYIKHKADILEHAQGYVAANRARVNERNRSGHNRRRAASADSDVTVETWVALAEAWEGRCAYCGTIPARLTQDHIRPILRGGPHLVSNLLPACQPCNSSKGIKMLSEWPRYQRLIQGVAK